MSTLRILVIYQNFIKILASRYCHPKNKKIPNFNDGVWDFNSITKN
jgi:hypothetical protein